MNTATMILCTRIYIGYFPLRIKDMNLQFLKRNSTSNTRDRVLPHLRATKRQFEIRRTVEYFLRTLMCLEMWLSVFWSTLVSFQLKQTKT